MTYSPEMDGEADPGEVVWAWVPYEDDPAQGKDHDRDAEDEARWGRYWMDVGTGAWDSQGRDSEIRLDRVLTLDDSEVRREGAALDETMFNAVVEAAKEHWG